MDIVKLVKTLLPEPTWNSLSDRLRTKQRIQYLNFIKKYGLSEILQKNGPHYFIHIPKTGGTSIKNYLRDNDIPTLFLSHDIEDPKYKYPNEISKKNNPHAFTVVRNPFDRVVSAYYFLKKKKLIKNFMKKYLMNTIILKILL
ncbi:sulfotransferase family 2 domain-containing protein [archaeon]|nr:sulfotransferase family 2 domain-containing protein [archaeon]MBT4648189.1 sulfotransferase family 2 domain-containing protein [archaeon]MBT6821009.1 sulfotransferase family 2 domain-containing protein [archaeon]MBT7391640.1 sulfotransferase family 2 domain-containing protein [archaeon]